MSNIGTKPDDGTQGKTISMLENELAKLKAKVNELEMKVRELEG